MMAKQLDPEIITVLKGYGFGPDACWDSHGTWVVYHKVLERIAAKAGIEYREPTVLVAEKDAAAILVTGILNDKQEWSIGEAVIGQNYKVSGKQAAYPFAMAEKRAKDRVILKLIGLHGLAYSEEEADDFKAMPQQQNSPQVDDHDAQRRGYVVAAHTAIQNGDSEESLRKWWADEADRRRQYGLTKDDVDELLAVLKIRFEELKEAA